MNSENQVALWLQNQGAIADLTETILALVASCIEIDDAVQTAAFDTKTGSDPTINVQGEEQKPLDLLTNDIVVARLANLPQIGALVSEEVADLIINKNASTEAPYAICFDPVDGSSNIETNGAIGTIFSVLGLETITNPISEPDVLNASHNQVAAAYVMYGPATILVLTTGNSVASFVLDKNAREFVLDEQDITLSNTGSEFAINMAYARFWQPQITTYIEHCTLGITGPRAKDFGMRWMGAMVADVHRLFLRGGIFLYPALAKPGSENGKLRFLYEANPMALLVEVAGGKALMGRGRILDHTPNHIHERVPVIMGSTEEVDIIAALFKQ